MWKKLVNSNELMSYEKVKGNLKVRIEARYNDNMWEIYKTYQSSSGNISLTEEYEANDRTKAKQIISKIKKEVLDEKRIKHIENLRKNLNVNVRRCYKEQNVEKWKFSINSEDFSNYIIIRYSDEIEMDVLVEESYKYIETELLDEVNKILGLSEFEKDVVQNIFFFSKKSGFYTYEDENKNFDEKFLVDVKFEDKDE